MDLHGVCVCVFGKAQLQRGSGGAWFNLLFGRGVTWLEVCNKRQGALCWSEQATTGDCWTAMV